MATLPKKMSCNDTLDERELMIITVAHSSISCLSLVSCSLAMGALSYYKLHRSFNHRLILYWLLGFAGVSLVRVLDFPVPWFAADSALVSYYCLSLSSLGILTGWISLLFSVLLVLELFSLVLCFVELRRIEIPYLCLSLILPVGIFWVPFISDAATYYTYGCLCNHMYVVKNCNVIFNQTTAGVILWYAPWYAMYGLVVAMITVILLIMTVRWCRHKYIHVSHLAERRHLLESHSIPNHSKAFKETVALLSCPVILCALILIYSLIRLKVAYLTSFWTELVFAFLLGSIGFFAALSVAIHLSLLGTVRRASLRKGTKRLVNRNSPRSELAGCINEGGDYTAAGSITATNLTEFEPPTESEVDKYRVFT